MKRKHISLWLAALVLASVLAGCSGTIGDSNELRTRIRELETALQRTENERDLLRQDASRFEASLAEAEMKLAEAVNGRNAFQGQVIELTERVNSLTAARDDLRSQVANLTATREQLQLQVSQLTTSRDNLTAMVQELTQARSVLETKVASLEQARTAALADALDAHAKIAQLNTKLAAQTRQMSELQTQVVSIRSVLEQLQQKLDQ